MLAARKLQDKDFEESKSTTKLKISDMVYILKPTQVKWDSKWDHGNKIVKFLDRSADRKSSTERTRCINMSHV